MPLSIGIIGATGKLGRHIVQLGLSLPEFTIAAGCASPRSPYLGIDLGALVNCAPQGIAVCSDKNALAAADVIIDVSLPEALRETLDSAIASSKPLVIGTTGHSPEALASLSIASEKIPILFSPNFSLGMLACLQAVQKISDILKGKCAIDIVEMHHDRKKDAPSGSALALAAATGLKKVKFDGRPEIPRGTDSLSIHSIRSGNIPGEHTILFVCADEKIEIKHQAFSGLAFAQGALEAAKFLAKKPPGLYQFRDIFEHA